MMPSVEMLYEICARTLPAQTEMRDGKTDLDEMLESSCYAIKDSANILQIAFVEIARAPTISGT